MRRLPLLLAIVAGVALWAAPSQAQVADFFKQYTANSAAPGEANDAVQNGYRMCPPHAEFCSGTSTLYHHISPAQDTTGAYTTDVLNVENCGEVVVCVTEIDNDTAVATVFVRHVLDDAATGPTKVLADINGDGVIDAGDDIELDGDDGADSDGDGTALQTHCMYGITGTRIDVSVTATGGDVANLATDNSYVEVSCR